MIRRTIKHRRKRRQLDPSNVPSAADATFTFTDPAGPVLTLQLTFDMSMSLGQAVADGGFSGWTFGTRTVTSAVFDSPNQITLTFNDTVNTGVEIDVPQNDPTLRTSQGGYVQPGAYLGT